MNTFQTFYRGIIEGGGYINLRKAILKYLKKNNIRTARYLDISYPNGSLTVEVGCRP